MRQCATRHCLTTLPTLLVYGRGAGGAEAAGALPTAHPAPTPGAFAIAFAAARAGCHPRVHPIRQYPRPRFPHAHGLASTRNIARRTGDTPASKASPGRCTYAPVSRMTGRLEIRVRRTKNGTCCTSRTTGPANRYNRSRVRPENLLSFQTALRKSECSSVLERTRTVCAIVSSCSKVNPSSDVTIPTICPF